MKRLSGILIIGLMLFSGLSFADGGSCPGWLKDNYGFGYGGVIIPAPVSTKSTADAVTYAQALMDLMPATMAAKAAGTPQKIYITEPGTLEFECRRGEITMTGQGEIALLFDNGFNSVLTEQFVSTEIMRTGRKTLRLIFTASWDDGQEFPGRCLTLVLSNGGKHGDAHSCSGDTSALGTATAQ